MASRGGVLVINCLSWQKNAFIGLLARSFGIKSAYDSSNIKKKMCSSAATLDIIDKVEEAEIIKSASSQISPSVFEHELVSKFVNCMMWDGKKSLSQSILKKALEQIKMAQVETQRMASKPEMVEIDPLKVFLQAVENAKPVIGVKSIRRAGRVYQVPVPLTPQRRRFLAMKWLITAGREQRTNKNARMYQKLGKELLDAYNNEGTAVRKKRELHRRAEDNRAYAHYRW